MPFQPNNYAIYALKSAPRYLITAGSMAGISAQILVWWNSPWHCIACSTRLTTVLFSTCHTKATCTRCLPDAPKRISTNPDSARLPVSPIRWKASMIRLYWSYRHFDFTRVRSRQNPRYATHCNRRKRYRQCRRHYRRRFFEFSNRFRGAK